MADRRRRADAVRNRESILVAASDLLRQGGPRPAIQVIASRAGVSSATIYRSFPTKHQLYTAAYARCMCEELVPTVDAIVRGELPAVEGLRVLAREQVRVAAGWLSEINDLPGWVDAFVDEFVARFEDGINEVMLSAQADSTLRADLGKEDISGVSRLFLGGLAQTAQPLERANRYIDLWFDAVMTR